MFKKYEYLEWHDIINQNRTLKHDLDSIYSFDIETNQDEIQLIRIPKILNIFDFVKSIEVNEFHKFFRIPYLNKELLKCVFDSFHRMKYFAIHIEYNNIVLKTSQMYNDEDFETFRNRCLFEVRDILDIKHSGYGDDSKMLKSKYTARNFELKMQD